MSRTLSKLSSILALAAALTFALPALAGEAQDVVQDRRAKVAAMMGKGASADRDKQVAAVLGNLFDFDAMARDSLGKHLDELSADQQKEFTSVLRQLVQRNIEKNVKATLNYDIAFQGEDPNDAGVLVKTKATSKDNTSEDPVQVDYQMHKNGDVWLSTDVITEGSSMVGNYRSQFNRIISKDGYAALIKKMRDKLAKETTK